MEKIFAFVLTFTLIFALAACGNSNSSESDTSQAESSAAPPQTESSSLENTQQTGESSETQTEAGSNALVVYFSWSGNTEAAANEIAAQTGADVFKITPAEPYTDDYDMLLDLAQEEQADDARPAIAETVKDFAQYDVVYFGFPNWWGDMPMILYTFLDDYDFSGKTIAPFVTSGGSGFSSTISTIESLEPDATVVDGLSLGSSEAADSGDKVTKWLSSVSQKN